MKLKSKISKSIIIVLIALQLAVGFNFVFTPKPAKAFLGIGDITFDTQIGNVYDILKDIGLAAAQRIAIQYANMYLQKFVDKLIDKYRIKDYLAYDKVLSGYYLNQYIYEHVSDPDLRAIYGILATDVNTRATVTDPKTGKKTPVLAALRQKLDSYYYGRGGIASASIYSPGAAISDEQYFESARAYFANPPSFSDDQLYGQFGKLVTDSQKASASEIAQSNGLKNDRSAPTGVVAHICVGPEPQIVPVNPNQLPGGGGPILEAPSNIFEKLGLISVAHAQTVPAPVPLNQSQLPGFVPNPLPNNRNTQAGCLASGGQWKVDASGMASAVIQNPSQFIHDFATNAINSIFSNNFGLKDNIYTTIGSLIGNFIFTQLTLDRPSGTIDETAGAGYVPANGPASGIKPLDLDLDGIPDAQDANGDGQPDFCIYGGVPNVVKGVSVAGNAGPPCQVSSVALTINNPSPPGGPAQVACSQTGADEQNFGLPLLASGTLPADVTNQINAQFGNVATFSAADNNIVLPEFTFQGPGTASNAGANWIVISTCK